MEKHEIIFAGFPPVMKDPRRDKERDHARRNKPMFKESKWARNLWKKMNRVRASQTIREAVASGDMELIDRIVDLPRTGGQWTW